MKQQLKNQCTCGVKQEDGCIASNTIAKMDSIGTAGVQPYPSIVATPNSTQTVDHSTVVETWL
jgi:hypothetical protein